MQVYNRSLKQYEPISQYGGGLLEILYQRRLGRALLKFVIHPVFSRGYGIYNRTLLSRRRIAPFVEEYGICMEDYEKREYASFNDFFIRKPRPDRRPVDMAETSFVSPADSKLSVYPITSDNRISVKGVEYTLSELVGGKASTVNKESGRSDSMTGTINEKTKQGGGTIKLTDYEGGLCLVFRLTMDDCHRYCFVDDGRVVKRRYIKGKLHTVSSISREHKVYRENFRVVNVLDTRNFKRMVCIEVGALLVGRIVNHPIRTFKKGMEKGYFEPGGSTIIFLMQKDSVELDEDIARICKEGTEVKIRLGEKIGSKVVC